MWNRAPGGLQQLHLYPYPFTLSSAPFPSSATVTLVQSFDWVFPPGTPSQDGPYGLFSAQCSRGIEHRRLEGRSPKHLYPPHGKRQMSLGPCGAAAEQRFQPIRTDRWWVVGARSELPQAVKTAEARGHSLIAAACPTLCRQIQESTALRATEETESQPSDERTLIPACRRCPHRHCCPGRLCMRLEPGIPRILATARPVPGTEHHTREKVPLSLCEKKQLSWVPHTGQGAYCKI